MGIIHSFYLKNASFLSKQRITGWSVFSPASLNHDLLVDIIIAQPPYYILGQEFPSSIKILSFTHD